MKRKGSLLLTIMGVAAVALGLFLIRRIAGPLPGVCIGLGAGILGHGLGSIYANFVARKHPEIARHVAIEQQDERNRAVNDRAKARAYDMMIYVFGVLMVVYTIINADLSVILMLVGAYLLIIACCIGFFVHYNKTI